MISSVARYRLEELAIGGTAGDSPFLSTGTVTRQAGYQEVGPVGTIAMDDKFPWLGKNILSARFLVGQDAVGAGDSLAFGLGGAAAANASLDPFIGFHLDGAANILARTNDGGVVTEVDTGFSLGNDIRQFVISLYEGVLTQSPPARSLGGIGHVLFSVENDAGQLTPVARTTHFDMSAHADSGFQIVFGAEGIGASLRAKLVDIEERTT